MGVIEPLLDKLSTAEAKSLLACLHQDDIGGYGLMSLWKKYAKTVHCKAHCEAAMAIWLREEGFMSTPLSDPIFAVSRECCMVCRLIARELMASRHKDDNGVRFDRVLLPEHIAIMPVALPKHCPLDVAEKVLEEVEARVVALIEASSVSKL